MLKNKTISLGLFLTLTLICNVSAMNKHKKRCCNKLSPFNYCMEMPVVQDNNKGVVEWKTYYPLAQYFTAKDGSRILKKCIRKDSYSNIAIAGCFEGREEPSFFMIKKEYLSKLCFFNIELSKELYLLEVLRLVPHIKWPKKINGKPVTFSRADALSILLHYQ